MHNRTDEWEYKTVKNYEEINCLHEPGHVMRSANQAIVILPSSRDEMSDDRRKQQQQQGQQTTCRVCQARNRNELWRERLIGRYTAVTFEWNVWFEIIFFFHFVIVAYSSSTYFSSAVWNWIEICPLFLHRS